MDEQYFDNEHVMGFQNALDLIKKYFEHHLSDFISVEEYYNDAGYWGTEYIYKETKISISCDRGGLENAVIIDGEQFSLWQFENKMKSVAVASEKNILFTLDILKKFIQAPLIS